jgi:hypothetical protein
MQLAREEARGPFLIRGYMYRNGILVEEVEKLRREGFWRPAPWRGEKNPPAAAELGALVFRGECAVCHPGWQGGAALAALPPFREEGAALRFLGGMEKGHPAFPAFAGSEREKAAVAAHIEGLLKTAGVTLAAPPPLAPPKAKEKKRARPALPSPPKAEERKEARPAPPAAPPPTPAKEPARQAPKEAPKEALREAPPKEALKEKAPGAPPSAPARPEVAPKPPAPPPAPAGEKAASPPGPPEAPAPRVAKPPEPRREEPKPPEPKREEPRPGPSSQAAPPAPPAGSPRLAGEAKKEAVPPAPSPSTPPPGGGGGAGGIGP